MKAVIQAGFPPPPFWKRPPLRLISSFSQTQSVDVKRQLFATYKTPQNQIKSISSELGALLVARIVSRRDAQLAGSVVAILCWRTTCLQVTQLVAPVHT